MGLPGLSSVLLSPPMLIGAGAAVLLAFGGIQTARLNHAKGDLTAARAALINPADKHTWQSDALQAEQDLGTCQTNEINDKAAIASQNASVAALKAESDQRTAEAQKAVMQARTAMATAQRYAAQIAAKTPGADKCDSALNLLRSP